MIIKPVFFTYNIAAGSSRLSDLIHILGAKNIRIPKIAIITSAINPMSISHLLTYICKPRFTLLILLPETLID